MPTGFDFGAPVVVANTFDGRDVFSLRRRLMKIATRGPPQP